MIRLIDMKKILMMALMAVFAISAHAQNHWTYNAHNYANTMTVVGVIHINDAEIPRTSMEVGAFCNGECRGSQALCYYSPVDRYLAYLTVYGQDGDVIQFKLYDAEMEEELQAEAPTLTFAVDAMHGNGGAPYLLDFTTSVDEVPIVAETNEVGATGAGGEVVGEGSYLYGEECTLTAVPDSGSYFLNWTENVDRAEVVVSTERVYTFVVTGKRDLVANFTATNPNPGSEQTLELNPGWNWISCYVECSEDLFASLKEDIAAANAVAQIKDMTSSTMLQNGKWSSSSLEFVNESMYMINLPNATTVTLTAPRTNAASHPVTLQPGWNWIGFPSDKPMSLAEAMSGLTPHSGDQIKNMSDASTYSNGAWGGSLVTMTPGEGYMYYNKDSESHTLVYPDLTPSVQGTVEVPEGMDASDIIISNFNEEVIPDEDGEFEIGYNNMLVAKNAETGALMYLALYSIENNNRGGKMRGNENALNAKETAILIALRLLPFDMRDGDDEVLAAMKEIVYSLDCVRNLEITIQATINAFGYLKEEAIEEAVNAVGSFFMEQLSSVITEIITSNIEVEAPQGLSSPQFYPTNQKHGVKLFIKDSESQYLSNPDRWSIKCKGYSSLLCPVRIVEGYRDIMHDHFTESPTSHSYTMPPMSLSQYVKLAEKTSLLLNPIWPNYIELYRQMNLAMNDEHYLLELTNVTMDNMAFELPRSANAIGILTPKDDEKAEVSAILYAVLDFLCAIPGVPPLPVENMVNAYLLDAEFMEYCHSQPGNTTGIRNIVDAANDKMPDVYRAVFNEDLALDFVNAYFFISNVCGLFDYAASLYLSSNLSSFTFPVAAEYYGMCLPAVQTSVGDVTPTTVTVSGSVEGGASAAVVERGFVYGDMANSESTFVPVGSGTGEFETTIENLVTGHRYYVMAYAKFISGELVYGNEQTFVAYDGSLYVLTFQPGVGNNSTTAAFCGAVSGYAGLFSPVIESFGFVYGTGQGEMTAVVGIGEGEVGSQFIALVDDLTANTTYYVKAYAVLLIQGSSVVLFGDEMSFFTGNHPTVTTHEVLSGNIGAMTATVTGSVVFPDANQPIEYERGFVISTSSAPISLVLYGENEYVVYNGVDLINYSCTLTGLWPNTTYYIRAYSYSENGVVYGDIVSFTTSSLGDNLVYNGDFELGNTGFETSYTYGSTGSYNHYYVGHDIAEMWSWDSPGFPVNDHTSGSGMFLMVDGALQNNTTAWSQTVNVTPNTDYLFSAWFLTNNVSFLKFEINGVSGPDFTTPSERWVWAQRSMTWNSGDNTQATIKIINRYAQSAGYDWCVDDIYFGAVSGSGGGNTGNNSEGTLNGVFTINENGDQVQFSQGNLQYQASTNTWRFAENQWDYVGSDNANISDTYSGWIDLFGWGTSGYNHGATCYQPWSTRTSNSDYYAYGSYSNNLYDQTGQADWGYNAISNGGNQENSGWRTPTREEWSYLFFTRSTSSGIRYAMANVNGVNGVILLPDDWSTDYYTMNNANTYNASFSSNTITATQWVTIEEYGTVFLPAAGNREWTSVYGVGSCGSYWSASRTHNNYAWSVFFYDSGLGGDDDVRYEGLSVRLVRASQ